MTKYDARVIQKFADKLCFRANTIVFFAAFVCLFLGGGVGACLGFVLSPQMQIGSPLVGLACGALIGAVFGAVIGSERTFELKLRAQ